MRPRQHLAREYGVSPLEPHDDRQAHTHLFDGRNDALGNDVAADDAAEDVDQNRTDPGIREDQLERRGDPLLGRAAADIQEIRRFAAVQLNQVHRGHGKAGAIDHARNIAVERHVVKVVLGGLAFHGVFLRGIAPRGQIRVSKQRVVFDVDLGVQRQKIAVRSDDERIDLD